MRKKCKIVLFAILILILILLPLFQIIFKIIPSNWVITDNKIQVFPKYYDDVTSGFNLKSNSINIKDKIDPYIQDLLLRENSELLIPIILYLNYQPGENITFQLEYNEKLVKDKQYYQKLYQMTKEAIKNSQDKLTYYLLKLNATIKHEFSIINAIALNLPLKNIDSLASNPDVAKISYDYELKASLQYSVPSMTNVPPNSWNYTSCNGSNVVVAVLDTGINESHPALQNVVIDRYNAITGGTDASDDFFHGTYVAGIIANTDPINTGVARNLSIINVKVLGSDGKGTSSDLMRGAEWVVTRAAKKPDIINFSGGADWQSAGEYDGMNSLTLFIDAITSMYNVLWINAAGNIPALIELPADAYNSIAVGELTDFPTRDTNRNNDVLAGTSSRGPTLDGRIKPDIVALGGNINSTWWTGGWSTAKTGTSFSAPHISGAAALIYDYLNKNTNIAKSYYPLVTKALLLATADDWSTSGPASDGPDSNTGWGYVNLANTWNLTHSGVFIETNSLSYDNIKYEEPYYYNLTLVEGEILNLTMVWNRHVLYTSGFLFISGNGRPNNLNLYLLNSTNYVVANSTDPVNNVEQITYPVPSNGTYYLKVISEDSQYAAPEPYALISSYNLSAINPSGPQLFYYTLSPDLDVDLDYLLFRNFDAFEKISFYAYAFDEDGISYGTFNWPVLLYLYVANDLPFAYLQMYPDLQNLVFKEIPLPMIQVFPYTLYFNLLLENLMVKQGVNRIMDIFLGGSLWTTFSIMDNNPISKASTTYFISLDYHGFIWDLSVYAITLLSLLIIIDLLRERRAKKIILESAEEQVRKEYEFTNF